VIEHGRDRGERPERALLLGGRGFVGRAIAERLAREGVACEATGRSDLDLLASDAAEGITHRLTPETVLVVISAEAPCRDAAGLVRNARMIEAVCSALARQAPAQIVYISSDAVYADDANPVTEDSSRSVSSLHGAMHLARELMLQTVPRVPLVILRPTLIYGVSDPHNGYGPNRFRRQAAAGEPIALFGEGEEQRDHVLVDDVATVAWKLIERRSRGVLNVATGRSWSFREAAELVASCFEPAARVQGSPRRSPITHRHFDVTQLLKAFPELRMTPLEEGIAQVHARVKAGEER
jgi:nucleoside-diphosphate-sugar epimerase